MARTGEQKSDTKQRLLESTLQLISEKGYLGATTREIAHHAGVTELTLFRHFGTKERLFEELLNSYTFLPKLRELLPELDSCDYESAMTLIAERFITTLRERKPMMKILSSEIHIYPSKVKKMYLAFLNEIRSTLAGYFAALQKEGSLRQVAPDIAARAFLGMLFNYFRTEEIMKDKGMTKREMDRNIKEMVDIFIHGTVKGNGRYRGETR
jgi:AcrR family transcriptional regulator